jgi:membrane-associated phospholipid phosphatase
MGPIALAIAGWLLANQAWRSALAWLSLFGAALFLVACTKVAFAGWGVGVPQIDFTGISGHSTSATSVFPVVGYFIGRKHSRGWAILAGAIGYCLGVAIGISRIILGDHSLSEVIVGCTLGGSIALASIAIIRSQSKIVTAPVVLLLAVLALAFTLHGDRAPSEKLTTKIALYLSGRSTPFVRGADWPKCPSGDNLIHLNRL